MAINNLSQKQLLRVVKICLGVVAICGMVWIFDGCAPAATIARKDGFEAQYRGFDLLKSESFEPVTTDLKLRVIVVCSPRETGLPNATATYSYPEGIIRIVGKKIGGKILTCPAVLGHEVQHALEYQGKGFFNPDQSEAYGY